MSEGFAGVRATGEMSWSLVEGRADFAKLIEYEIKVNEVIAQLPITACCQYDARRFDGASLMSVLAVHPLMLVHGQLVRNPFVTDPASALQKVRRRVAAN
jgi:hypothetical protein